MTTAATPTPEFLIWALELRCPLRDIEGFEQPERTDRQLRAARAASDARHERREFAGLCIAMSPRELAIPAHAAFGVERATTPATAASLPQAFRTADALQLFGDASAIDAACRNCPANAEEQVNPQSWAGCYGIVPLPEDTAAFHAAIESSLDAASREELRRLRQLTTPAWYGFWLRQRVMRDLACLLRPIITQAANKLDGAEETTPTTALQALARGLEVAANSELPMNVALYPCGSVIGRWWNLEPSCPNCKATLTEPATRCHVCGWSGRQGTPPKRRSRGTRPYRPLKEIVGESEAKELLASYQARRTQEAS